MNGHRHTHTGFFADFLAYLIKRILWLGLLLFAIHRLSDAFGAGLFIGSARPEQQAFDTRIASTNPTRADKKHGHLSAVESTHPEAFVVSRRARPAVSRSTTAPTTIARSQVELGNENESNEKHKPFEQGKASFYGKRWSGRKTANGEIFDHRKFTAAHKKLPFGTYVQVVRTDTKQSVVVRINDRGPFIEGRIIDLSSAAAEKIKMLKEGVAEVGLYRANVADYLKQFKK